MVRGAAIRPAASRTIRQAQGRRRETLLKKEPTQGAQGTVGEAAGRTVRVWLGYRLP